MSPNVCIGPNALTMDKLFVGRDTDRTVTDGAMKAAAPASMHTKRETTRENMFRAWERRRGEKIAE